jgi:hypothetical protein
LDEENLMLHNTRIMNLASMSDLAPSDIAAEKRAYRWGRVNPGILSIDRCLPRALARFVPLSINVIGLLQPVTIDKLALWLVLEITRR